MFYRNINAGHFLYVMEQMEKFKKYGEKLKLFKSKTDVEIVGPVETSFATDFMIGQGSFGTTVFLGLDDNDNPAAVKRILTQTAACLVKVEKEAKLLDLLQLKRSKHIVSYRHFESGDPFSYLILDLCEEDLADFVMSNSKDYLQRQGPVIIKEILTGLHALHSGAKKILHMDLKPENILAGGERGREGEGERESERAREREREIARERERERESERERARERERESFV